MSLRDLLAANSEEKSNKIENPDHFCSKGPARKVLRPVTVALFLEIEKKTYNLHIRYISRLNRKSVVSG